MNLPTEPIRGQGGRRRLRQCFIVMLSSILVLGGSLLPSLPFDNRDGGLIAWASPVSSPVDPVTPPNELSPTPGDDNSESEPEVKPETKPEIQPETPAVTSPAADDASAGSNGINGEAAPGLADTIRVALFANIDRNSPGLTNQVTFSSAEGMSFSPRGASNRVSLGNTQARFSLDDYQVKVFESKDRAAAQAVLKQVQASNSGRMLQVSRRGASFYAVYAGAYLTESQAQQGLKKIQADSVIGKLLKGYTPQVMGPHYVQAGTYASLNEAAGVHRQLLDHDMDAYLVTMVSGGTLHSAVWVGQASSAAKLDLVIAKINAEVPGLTIKDVQATGALIHTAEDIGSATLPHYRVFGSEKWVVQSASTIKVAERSQRTYRGMMEVSAHKQKLALVNELPVEQYLLSVVGGEVSSSWPAESIKAQAITARTFALYQGNKFEIANVVDTTVSQAYFGVDKEHPNIAAGVKATEGLVLMNNGKLIESIFHSNAGGITADPKEVWGGSYDWFKVVDSPTDQVAMAGKKKWFYVTLPNGKVGYVREDVVKKDANKNSAGFELAYAIEEGTNIRPIPSIQSSVKPIGQVDKSTPLVILDTVSESTEYEWVRGPYTGQEIAELIRSKTKTELSGSATKLEVMERGPSGRVMKVKVNGIDIMVSSPDSLRTAFGGLPSTLFEVDSSSSYSVVGADGKQTDMNGVSGKYAISAGSASPQGLKDGTVVLDGEGKARVLTSVPAFMFTGKGYGHGIGMSQWGARGLAEQGYDYREILQYYYNNVEIVKR